MNCQAPVAAELPRFKGLAHHRQLSQLGSTHKTSRRGQSNWQTHFKLALSVTRAVNGKENFPFSEGGRALGIPETSPSQGTSLSRRSNAINDQDKEIEKPVYEQKGNIGEDPYRILETGSKLYLDELDVLTLLDPPSFLIPTDANSYNQAAYLWKKIGDIPKERRHRLLDLLTPKQVANMWDITGEMYGLPNSPLLEPANVLLGTKSEFFMKPVTWTGKAFNVSWPLTWFSTFKKAFFLAPDGSVYGRVITGGWLLQNMTKWLLPLYFEAREIRKVVATEEPCHIALEYGDGQLHLPEVPKDFPRPAKHPWPFNDASFDYLRPAGPGVLVGQWWIEGVDLEQMPDRKSVV